MTTAAICEPGALTRSDVLACIPHLRAFAAVLAGDRRRADDLVCDTIEQTFAGVNRPHAGIDLNLQMFSTLHRLHYARCARQPKGRGNSRNRRRAGRMIMSRRSSSIFSDASATSGGKR
jgi:DNA-directed RNA polymerase specialized sigma24 family protein